MAKCVSCGAKLTEDEQQQDKDGVVYNVCDECLSDDQVPDCR